MLHQRRNEAEWHSRQDLGNTNLNRQLLQFWHNSGSRLFKEEFQSLSQVGEGFLFRSPLAGYINFKALGNEPFAFTPNDSREAALHHIAPPLIRETPLSETAQAVGNYNGCKRKASEPSQTYCERNETKARPLPTDIAYSVNGVPIRLTEERWRHIVIEHQS